VPDDGDLGQLLAAEERLERLVAAARAEAARLLADADAAATSGERVLDIELEKEAVALTARLTGEGASREADILAAAAAAAARYDGIVTPRVEAVAEMVVARLLAVP
jgi:vacuolar-type H+-ATPase subunit H